MLRQLTLGIVCIMLAPTSLMAQVEKAPEASPAQPASVQRDQTDGKRDDADSKFTLMGDIALWTVSIRPDKTADFERVMSRLREALTTSEDLARRRQADGWKLVRLATPLPDGNVAYVHLIRPVVPEADYSVMRALYDAFPKERQELYELYRGAFAGNVALAAGTLVLDLSDAPATAVPGPPREVPPPHGAPAPDASQTPGQLR